MKEIPLTQGRVSLVDDEDYEMLSKFKWCCSLQGKQRRPYAIRRVRIEGVDIKLWLHRVIMNCPPTHVVDHINGDGLDNRKENLRIVLYELNQKYAAEKTNSRPRGNKLREEPSL